MQYKTVIYLVVLILIIVLIPTFEYYLFNRSIQYIYSIKASRDPVNSPGAFSTLMNYLSKTGEMDC